jgi:hypothetical protein
MFDQALCRIAALASETDQAFRLVDLVNSRVQAGMLDHTPVLRVVEVIESPEARARPRRTATFKPIRTVMWSGGRGWSDASVSGHPGRMTITPEVV